MADGIQIGRGYIAVDLDEASARAVLDAFGEKVRETLDDASKKVQLDISTAKADAELDRTNAKIRETQKEAKDANNSFSGLGGTLSTVARYIGLWAPAFSAGTLALHAAAGGAISLIGAAGNLLGVLGLVPGGAAVAAASLATITIGFKGVGTALAALDSGNAKKIDAAMKSLAPNAQKFVEAIHGLDFKGLHLDVQNALFANLNGTIKDLGATQLPVLRAGLTGVAQALNTGFQRFAASLTSPQALSDTSRIFLNIKDTLLGLVPAGVAFSTILRNITAVGAEFLPSMASHLSDLANRMEIFVYNARQTGQLATWIDNGRKAFDALAGTVGNILTIFNAVVRAGQSAGANFLGTLRDITGQISQFLNSAQGQHDIAAILQTASAAAATLLPILKDAANVIGAIVPNITPLATQLAPGVDALVRSLGPGIHNLVPGLQAVAHAVEDILLAVAPVIPAAAALASTLAQSAGPAVGILAFGLRGLAPILQIVNAGIQGLQHALGPVLPVILAVTAAWIAFSKATDFFTKGDVGKAFTSAGKAVADFGTKVGGAVSTAVPYSKAGTLITDATSKVGSALGKVGGAIPIVGAGLTILGALWESQAQKVADSNAKLAEQQVHMRDLAGDAQNLGSAQGHLKALQDDYNDAVSRFGPNSYAARDASKLLQQATQNEGDAEWYAQQATKSHQQALADLQNQVLASMNASANLKIAELDLADAQTAATDAVKKSGAQSAEAERAEANYELSLNRVVQAAHDKAIADNATLPPSQQVAAANRATTQEILDLALAAGDNAPPALRKLVGSLSDAQLQAFQSTGAIDGTHTAVITLPSGKTITLNVDNATGMAHIQQTQQAIDNVHGKVAYLDIIERVQAPPNAPSLSLLPGTAFHASGGPVKAGAPIVVGEQGPELIIPSHDGYVMPSAQTRMALAGAGNGNPGPTLNQTNYFSAGLSEDDVASMAASKAAFKLRSTR